jgi:thiosulfate reductase cytochrome b subunit
MDWIQNHEAVMWWLAAASVIFFLASLIAAPLVAIKIPPDYFTKPRKDRKILAVQNPVLKTGLKIVKNIVGYVFIVAGLLMLVLPGQGVLTILIGVILADFPGKDRMLIWLVRRGSVIKSINWLRKRARAKPLEL